LKRLILIISFVFPFSYCGYSQSPAENKERLFQRFIELYDSGDLVKAEKALLLFLESKDPLTDDQLAAGYNNLGVVNLTLGNYDNALKYNLKSENFISKKDYNTKESADIFNNIGRIYNIKKSFDVSIQYLEKSIRIYRNLGSSNRNVLNSLSAAYINISIALNETKKNSEALSYLENNVKLNSKFKLSNLSFTYLNIAKTYVNIGIPKKAEEFYLKSISNFHDEYGEDYYRLAEVYYDYGLFLRSAGKLNEALIAHNRALSICVRNYGEKHTLTSLSYKHVGDDYLCQNKMDSALWYYQKSLIAVVKNFNNPDVFTNPSIDSSLFDIRLLDNLKSKAQALDALANEQKDTILKLNTTGKSLETIELAIKLIDRIRNNYMSEESRIYLAENEKETYLFAVHLAYNLYSMKKDKEIGYRMYSVAQKAEAAILRNEISGNELLYSAGIPDSLRVKQTTLIGNIAAYNNLLLDESRKTKPDSNKIILWKDALFDMNRAKERVEDEMEKVFPAYHDLIRKTEPLSLKVIQKQLKNEETIVDYLLSDQYKDGKRRLYIFLISRNSLDFSEQLLDSCFARNAELIRKTSDPSANSGSQKKSFADYTGALNYMYLNLIKPVKSKITGQKVIIIPDGEICWLPFDAFLKELPDPDQTDYEGLSYLINDYTFSYGYSSSLIFANESLDFGRTNVYAFSPDYRNGIVSANSFSALQGAGSEIGSIFKWFRGKEFSNENATKANFLTTIGTPAIFHLAMHAMSDSMNPRYSYLMFDNQSRSTENSRLYNYEISLTRIKSPMVVLSACNSGMGILYSGEGLMSLARSFILAGASSVIKTSWEINDETSSAIITMFYYHLSKGRGKDESMRLAKLDYLKKSSPAFTNPYYWAAYEVLGDRAPVTQYIIGKVLIVTSVLLIAAAMAWIYFKRRKIFSDLSR
jgi:CHAT domain-containing protein